MNESYDELIASLLRAHSDYTFTTQAEINGSSVYAANEVDLSTNNTCDRNDSQNSRLSNITNTDEMLQIMLRKLNALEDFMIKFDVKLDCMRTNDRRTPQNLPVEIDMSELKSLGLPAEFKEDIEKLEANMKNDDFKQKLVS